jgi:hypothetical protein
MHTSMTLQLAGALSLVAGLTMAAAGCVSGSRFDGPDGDRRLYEARCGFCHVPFSPSDVHPDDWPGIVDDMAARSGLDAAYRERVTRYLQEESTKARASR